MFSFLFTRRINVRRFQFIFIGCLCMASMAQSQVFIHELMAWNVATVKDADYSQYGDWVELKNEGSTSVDLSGYTLTDDRDDIQKWTFPQGTGIAAGGFLLVWTDGMDYAGSALHTGFKLNVAGEFIGLYNPSGSVVDSVSFSRQFQDVSYGRGAGSNWYYFAHPTPGSSNNEGSAYQIAYGIGFHPFPGVYSGSQSVELSSAISGAEIRYTLDGSEPDESSTLYTDPIEVSITTVIRARAYASGYLPGWTETGSYIINFTSSLPVISLSTTPANLWDDQIGIYVTGTNGITGYCSDIPRNYNQDWERPASIEYFDPSGKREFAVDAGIKIYGACSRGFDMKSLAIYCRNEYGYDEIRYPIFREKPAIKSYKDIVLRNSGNDFPSTMMRDAVMQAIVKGRLDVDAMAYQPSVLFINGTYWGIHNIREKINEHYVESNYDIPSDKVDLLENYNTVLNGTSSHYLQMMSYLSNHSLVGQADYNYVASRMDVDEYINYLITEMFYANTDWPGNNVKYWRPQATDGRWRWILYDLDFGLGLYGTDPSFNMFTFTTETNGPGWPNPPWSTYLFRRLLENQSFRDKFVQQYSLHLNITFQPWRTGYIIDSLETGIEPEFQRHIDKWGQPSSMANWYSNVSFMKDWASRRVPYEWQYMQSYFGLGAPVDVILAPADPAKGLVSMNAKQVDEQGGIYEMLINSKLLLDALPSPGYQLSKWKIDLINSQNMTLLSRNSMWKYYDQAAYPGDSWKDKTFNDNSWATGQGELGYGDGGETTVISYGPNASDKYITAYFRIWVNITDPSLFTKFSLGLLRDDGAIIYVNGTEVLRVLMPDGPVTMQTLATTTVGGTDETSYFTYNIPGNVFTPGANLIAVEVHQASSTSSDLSFDLALYGTSFQVIGTNYSSVSNLSLPVTGAIRITALFEPRVDKPPIYINEFMASNQLSKKDEYGEYDDWIELYNKGNSAVNLAGSYITDNLKKPLKWKIITGYPDKTTISAYGYLLMFADGDSTRQGPLHTNFKLEKSGEEIGIGGFINSTFHWYDTLTYGAQQTDISMGRYPDGGPDIFSMTYYSPGSPNTLTSVPEVSLASMVLVYPNPARDIVNILIDPEQASGFLADVEIYDLTGKVLLQLASEVSAAPVQMDISSLPAGMYILHVRVNNILVNQRLVKQ
jgi:hypothetical protein